MKALDLINYLVPAQSAPDVPLPELPMGQHALGVSVLSTPLPQPTLEASAYDVSLGIATKSQAISKAASALLQAADSFDKTTAATKQDWRKFCEWQTEGWTLNARGARKGASMGPGFGSELTAREIVAILAASESPPAVKYNNVGYLSTTEDGNCDVASTERILGRRRLQIEVSLADEEPQIYLQPFSQEDLLRQSQIELFEEELFSEVRQTDVLL